MREYAQILQFEEREGKSMTHVLQFEARRLSAGVTPSGNFASLPGERFRHNDINPRLFPPFTPLVPLTEMAIRDRRGIGIRQYGRERSRVSFFLRAIFFPRRQYGASRDAPERAFAFRARTTVRRPVRPLSPLLSHYRRRMALFWIIDCTQRCDVKCRRNHNGDAEYSRSGDGSGRQRFIIYRLDYCYRSTRLRAK